MSGIQTTKNMYNCDPCNWQPLMLAIVESLKADLNSILLKSSKEKFRTLMILEQLEVQARMGHLYDDEAITTMICELNNQVSPLQIEEKKRGNICTNINGLFNVYFEHPKDVPSEVPHIILFGETSVGKSSLANILLGKEQFKDKSDVGVEGIQAARGKWLGRGQEVMIIDTPGTNVSVESEENLFNSMAEELRSLEYITTFTLVFNSSQCRLTDSHKRMIRMMQEVFGNDILCNASIAFTHWPRDKASMRRRKSDTEENRAREANAFIRKEYNLDFDLPCVFLDNIEWKMDDDRSNLEALLDDFFCKIKKLHPYPTINIKDLTQQNQELHRLLDNLSKTMKEYKAYATKEQAEAINDLVAMIEREIHDQPHLKRSSSAANDSGDVPAGGSSPENTKESTLKRRLRLWRNASDIFGKVIMGLQIAKKLIPVPYKVYLRGALVVITVVKGTGDAVAFYYDE